VSLSCELKRRTTMRKWPMNELLLSVILNVVSQFERIKPTRLINKCNVYGTIYLE
jgi:hypothetical protein